MYFQKAAANKWAFSQIWDVFLAGGTISNVLTFCSIALGLVMMSGSAKAWKFALALLGGFIIVQLFRLDKDMKNHWISGIAFLINVISFAFIADQLVFKQKFDNIPQRPQPKPNFPPQAVQQFATPAQTVAPTPIVRPKPASTSRETIYLAFEKENPWAQLLSISPSGLELRALKAPPAEIQTKEIEIKLGSIPLRMSFSKASNEVFFFEFKALNPEQIHAVNSWLLLKSQAA